MARNIVIVITLAVQFFTIASLSYAVNCGTLNDGSLELISCDFDTKNKVITGKVRNISDVNLRAVYVFFVPFDAENNQLDSVNAINLDLLKGSVWPFKPIQVDKNAVRVVPVRFSYLRD